MVLVAILIWAIACILAAQAAPAAVLPPTANSVSATTALPSPRLTATATFATGSPSQTALQPGAQVAAPFLPHRTAMPVNASPYAKEQPDCGGVDHNLSSAVLAATATAPYATVTATSLPGHVIGGGGGGDENALCTELETLSTSSEELDNESDEPGADNAKDHSTDSTNPSKPTFTQQDTYHFHPLFWLGGLAIPFAVGCPYIMRNCRYIKVKMTPDGLGIGAASFNIGDEHTSATALGLLNRDRAWPPAPEVSATQGGGQGVDRGPEGGNRGVENADRAGEGTDDGGEDGSRGEEGGMEEGCGDAAPRSLFSSIFAPLTGR